MLFNSIDFAVFLPIVFVLYWFVFQKQLRLQNLLLVVVSYVFYGWWDWRFLLLIVFSSAVDFLVSYYLKSQTNNTKRKLLLYTSIGVNIGLLGFFKYFNFFVDNFINAFTFFGSDISVSNLNIILPVGISFYTFQTLSYTIDVYNKKLEPTKDVVSFFAFVSFFPQLVAGPIERAKNLLPQFYVKREFELNHALSGVYLIVWGLFKKIVIADSCAIFVNDIFANYEQMNALSLIMGSVYFAFQIYGDFSGYSDIAIGTARLFGFNLMQNFNYPYFSRNVSEFWNRWHISLNSWFRDYVYIPLGGSKLGKFVHIRNVFIVFLVSGLWHGANWTFIAWGLLNACYFLPLLLFDYKKKRRTDLIFLNFKDGLKQVFYILSTFVLTCIGWVFFRADSIDMAINYLKGISDFNFNVQFLSIDRYSIELLVLMGVFIGIEWWCKDKEEPISGKFAFVKLVLVIIGIASLGSYSNPQDFIYFQF